MSRFFIYLSGVALLAMVHISASLVPNCVPEHEYSMCCVNRTEGTTATEADLCRTSLFYTLLDTNAGLVEFSLLLPYNEPKVDAAVKIWSLLDVGEGDKCSEEVDGVHSQFTLNRELQDETERGFNLSCLPHQVKKLEWKSNYMFTGCYRVEVHLNYHCLTNTFRIKSDFKKDRFADLSLPLLHTLVGNKVRVIVTSDLLRNDCKNPQLSSPCLRLSFFKDPGPAEKDVKMWEHQIYASHPVEKSPEDVRSYIIFSIMKLSSDSTPDVRLPKGVCKIFPWIY